MVFEVAYDLVYIAVEVYSFVSNRITIGLPGET